MGTDSEWQEWGATHPYYGVITDAQYRGRQLPPEAKEKFFRTGRDHMNDVLASCRTYFGTVSTERSLDFGCGVGRLLIPMAEVAGQAVGVDIAQSMLDETARNCAERGIKNVTLARTLADLPTNQAKFTFINSYTVLQHVAPAVGIRIIGDLLDHLDTGGCAALHVTYARGRYVATMGARPPLARAARAIRLPLQRIRRRLRGRGDPQMQMHEYDLNEVLFLAQHRGIRTGGFQFTDHRSALGVTLFVKRP